MKKKVLIYLGAPAAGIVGAVITMLILSACATSQNILPPEELIVQEVIEVEGKTKDELYVSAMEWIAKTFKSSKAVIQYEDKEAGKIVGKGFTQVTYTILPVDTWFTITIEAKEAKVRVSFEDMYTSMVISGNVEEGPLTTQKQMDKFKPEAQKLINSLRIALEAEEENW